MILLFSNFDLPEAPGIILTFMVFVAFLVVSGVIFVATGANEIKLKSWAKRFTYAGLLTILVQLILALPMVGLSLFLVDYLKQILIDYMMFDTVHETYHWADRFVGLLWFSANLVFYVVVALGLSKTFHRKFILRQSSAS